MQSKTFKLELTEEEIKYLANLLVNLVQENPPFWPKIKAGKPEKMDYSSIVFCIGLVNQIAKLFPQTAQEGGPQSPPPIVH